MIKSKDCFKIITVPQKRTSQRYFRYHTGPLKVLCESLCVGFSNIMELIKQNLCLVIMLKNLCLHSITMDGAEPQWTNSLRIHSFIFFHWNIGESHFSISCLPTVRMSVYDVGQVNLFGEIHILYFWVYHSSLYRILLLHTIWCFCCTFRDFCQIPRLNQQFYRSESGISV